MHGVGRLPETRATVRPARTERHHTTTCRSRWPTPRSSWRDSRSAGLPMVLRTASHTPQPPQQLGGLTGAVLDVDAHRHLVIGGLPQCLCRTTDTGGGYMRRCPADVASPRSPVSTRPPSTDRPRSSGAVRILSRVASLSRSTGMPAIKRAVSARRTSVPASQRRGPAAGLLVEGAADLRDRLGQPGQRARRQHCGEPPRSASLAAKPTRSASASRDRDLARLGVAFCPPGAPACFRHPVG